MATTVNVDCRLKICAVDSKFAKRVDHKGSHHTHRKKYPFEVSSMVITSQFTDIKASYCVH